MAVWEAINESSNSNKHNNFEESTNGRLTEQYLDPEPRHANLALQLIFARIN